MVIILPFNVILLLRFFHIINGLHHGLNLCHMFEECFLRTPVRSLNPVRNSFRFHNEMMRFARLG